MFRKIVFFALPLVGQDQTQGSCKLRLTQQLPKAAQYRLYLATRWMGIASLGHVTPSRSGDMARVVYATQYAPKMTEDLRHVHDACYGSGVNSKGRRAAHCCRSDVPT